MMESPKERLVYGKNKPRKILTLEERVQALRMFDHTPVYQRVATILQCSWEQIKNVVLNRDEIMRFYARCQTINPGDHPNQVRKKKILFLGNVVYEYIKRALYHSLVDLDEQTIRERALEFRNAIDIAKFYPNNAWFNDFKRIYNVDLTSKDSILLTKPPPETLDCQLIIEYCRNEIEQILLNAPEENDIGEIRREAEASNGGHDVNDNDDNDNVDDDEINENEEGETIDFSQYDENDLCDSTETACEPKSKKAKSHKASRQTRRPKIQPHRTTTSTTTAQQQGSAVTSTLSTEHVSTNNVGNTLRSIKAEQRDSSSKVLLESSPTTTEPLRAPLAVVGEQAVAKMRPAAPNGYKIPAQIFDAKAAISHLYPLQDYALAEEDFVAINLLEKLAAHYRGGPKNCPKPQTNNCAESSTQAAILEIDGTH